MDRLFLLSTFILIVFVCLFEVGTASWGGKRRGRTDLVLCKKTCKKNCTLSSCKLECKRDCKDHANVQGGAKGKLGTGILMRCRKICRQNCTGPGSCKIACLQNCVKSSNGNHTTPTQKHKGRVLGRGMMVPFYCKRTCKDNCNRTSECKADCLSGCTDEDAGMKCRKACRETLECIYPECTTCKIACINRISECLRASCVDVCRGAASDEDDAGKGRRKPAKVCKKCRMRCNKEDPADGDDTDNEEQEVEMKVR